MGNRTIFATLSCTSAFLLLCAFTAPAEARGGFSRISPASGGGFASSAGTRPTARHAGTWTPGEDREPIRDELQQRREDVRDRLHERRDWPDDDLYDNDYGAYWDDHWQGEATPGGDVETAGAAGGDVTELPCSGASYVVGDDVYYQCDSSWYRRGFLGGMLIYTASAPPPGV